MKFLPIIVGLSFTLAACEFQQMNTIDIPTSGITSNRRVGTIDTIKAKLLNHTYIYCDDLGGFSDERQYKFTAPFNLEETIVHHSDTNDCSSAITTQDVTTFSITAIEESTAIPIVAPIYTNYKFSLNDGSADSERVLDVDPDGFFLVEVRDILCGTMDRCVTRPGNAIYNGTHYIDPAFARLKPNLTGKTYEVCESVGGTHSRKFSVTFEQNTDFVMRSINESLFVGAGCGFPGGMDYEMSDVSTPVVSITETGTDTYDFKFDSGRMTLGIAPDYNSIEMTVLSTCPPMARCGAPVEYQLTLSKI